MKTARFLVLLFALVFAVIGCSKKNDEADIEALLAGSWFIGGEIQTADDSTDTPSLAAGPFIAQDTFPWYVKWVRWIERPVDPNYSIDVVGDSAFVTITAYFQGTPPGYGFFIRNDTLGPILTRAIMDSVVRKVKCYRDEDGWHIASLTVADIYTTGSQDTVTITQVRAYVASRGYQFIVNDANTFFSKGELPTFLPNDTVEVSVTCYAQYDTTWAFLHHGAGHRPGVGLRRHWRQPFYRETATTFRRTWYIADDSIVSMPTVRHSAVDVLGWQTLFGDSTAMYYSRAWALPYIIKNPNDSLPPDAEEP